MATPTDLATSGALYGPNFGEWKERIMATLRLQGLETYVDLSNEASQEASKSVATFITFSVIREIVQRVPFDEVSNTKLLMQRLEKIATQFRFLDLPPEIRHRIYKLALPITIVAPLRKQKQAKYPVLTRTSPEIRTEILPLFDSATTLKLNYATTQNTTDVAKPAQKWMLNVARENVKHLRSISISLPLHAFLAGAVIQDYPWRKEIRLNFDTVNGMNVQYPDNVTLLSKRSLRNHVNDVKKASEMLGCKNHGGALFLALVMNPSIWSSLKTMA